MESDNSFESSDNMFGAKNTPTIHELFEACEHLGDHISYNAETNKMYHLLSILSPPRVGGNLE